MKKLALFLLKSALGLVVFAGLCGGYAVVAHLVKGKVFVEISTDKEGTFELENPRSLVLVDTNTGLGSSPGKIDPDRGVRLYQPDGTECELDRTGYDGGNFRFGEYHAPNAGTYRFVLDKLKGAQSDGALMAPDPLPWRGSAVVIALTCLVLSFPVVLFGTVLLLIFRNQDSPKI